VSNFDDSVWIYHLTFYGCVCWVIRQHGDDLIDFPMGWCSGSSSTSTCLASVNPWVQTPVPHKKVPSFCPGRVTQLFCITTSCVILITYDIEHFSCVGFYAQGKLFLLSSLPLSFCLFFMVFVFTTQGLMFALPLETHLQPFPVLSVFEIGSCLRWLQMQSSWSLLP
jgi:hypothetical protein